MFTLCSPFQLAFVSLGTYGEVKVISENMEAVNFKENERLSRLDDGNDLSTDTVFQSNENLKPSVLEYVHQTTLAFFNTTMETLTDTKTSDGAIDSNVNSDLVENQLNATENSNASSVVNDNKNITSYVVSTTCVNETEMEGTYCCEMCPDFDINKLNYIFICFSIIRRIKPGCGYKIIDGIYFGGKLTCNFFERRARCL